MKYIYTILLLAFLAVSQILANPLNRTKLDSLLDVLSENDKSMFSLAISQNGKIIYNKAIGYSYIGENNKTPSNEKTKYRIGSISKVFTATLIFQLVEEKKLELSNTLAQYFPEIPNSEKITISNLLYHRSGVYNFTNDAEYLQWMTKPKTQSEMLAIIAKNKSVFEPDEKAEYSNSNYVLLGYIIEKVTKKSYKDILQEKICSKIGLADTYYGSKTNLKANESISFYYNNGWILSMETDMSIPHGAGAIVSTPSDLTKFIVALFSNKLININSLETMTTMNEGYGMGIFEINFASHIGYGHDGGIDAFTSSLNYFPDERLAIALCVNGQAYPMGDIVKGIISICLNEPYDLPIFKTVTLKEAELEKYLGVYSSSDIPLKITVTKKGATLIAQADGQDSFELVASGDNIFRFDEAGIVMLFKPEKNEFILKQAGYEFLFVK